MRTGWVGKADCTEVYEKFPLQKLPYEHQLHLSGQMCGNCGWQWYQWGFSNLGSLVGHVVQAGDKLRWRQWLNNGSKGGLIMTMTDGTETWMNGYKLGTVEPWLYNGCTVPSVWVHTRQFGL